jgi:nitrogen fixation-related uncharacterized protein
MDFGDFMFLLVLVFIVMFIGVFLMFWGVVQ